MDQQLLRRGLPRAPGGEPWPPAGATATFAVVTPGVAVGTAKPSAAPAPPAAAPASVTGLPLRRGLPRTPGGEAWPPAGATATFPVVAPMPDLATGPTVDRTDPTQAVSAPSSPASSAPHSSPSAEQTGRLETIGTVPTVSTPGPTSPDPSVLHSRPSRRWRRLVAWSAVGVAALVVAVAVSRWFVHTQTGEDFLERYPGMTPLPDWVPVGIPTWMAWQHFLNAFFMVMLVRAALMVRSGRRPAATWTRKHPRPGSKKIAVELWTHLSLDLLWIVNGAIFAVLLFATGQWARVVPLSWDVVPNAVSSAVQYLSLDWPAENGWAGYNDLQVLGYFLTSMVAAPLAAVTGWRMSPLWPARWRRLSTVYTTDLAKAVHFPVMVYFVIFAVLHVGLVLLTGPVRNLNHMYAAHDGTGWWGPALFAVSVVIMVGGWLALRPAVMKQVGALFGKIGR